MRCEGINQQKFCLPHAFPALYNSATNMLKEGPSFCFCSRGRGDNATKPRCSTVCPGLTLLWILYICSGGQRGSQLIITGYCEGWLLGDSRSHRKKNISELEKTPSLTLCSVKSRKKPSLQCPSASPSSKNFLLLRRHLLSSSFWVGE